MVSPLLGKGDVYTVMGNELPVPPEYFSGFACKVYGGGEFVSVAEGLALIGRDRSECCTLATA